MRAMALIMLLMAGLIFSQSSVNCTGNEVSNYSTEVENNAGSKVACTLGKGSGYGYYAMLIRADLTGASVRLPCSLIVRQYAFTSGGTAYDFADGEFKVEVSTVKGTFETGSSTAVKEEGASCWKYRAYSATSPVPWDPADPAPGLQSVSRGNNGSHINSTPVHLFTAASGTLSFAILDSQLVADLVNGCGGLLLSRDQDELANQMKFWNSPSGKPLMLSWDPAGTPVARELVALNIRSAASLTCEPNPFNQATAIRLNSVWGASPVLILDLSGRLVRTLHPTGGAAVWDGLNANGVRSATGTYLLAVDNGRSRAIRAVTLAR